MLLDTFTVLGASLPTVRCLYSRKWQAPCMQTFVAMAILRSLEDSSLVKPDTHISSDNLKDRIIPRWDMVITDEDFNAVLALVEPLYLHATHILSFLVPSVVKSRGTADRDMLFAGMEDESTRQQLLEKAHGRGIPETTALTWLKRLTKQGALVSVDGKGTYHKN